MHISFYLILLSILILSVGICIALYPLMGIISPNLILGLEQKIRKHIFKKNPIIIIDTHAYFKERQKHGFKLFLVSLIVGNLIIFISLFLLR